MKKKLLPAVLGLAAILAVSCNKSVEESENYYFTTTKSPLDNVSNDVRNWIGNSYDGVCDSIEINFDLQREGLSEEAAALIDAEIVAASLGEQYRNMDICDAMAAFADSLTTAYASDCASCLSKTNETLPPAYFFDQRYNINAQVFSMGRNSIQYVISTYSYSGGAHGYSADYYIAFDRKSGKRITIDDIFSDKSRLKEVLEQKASEDERTYEDLEMFISPVFLLDEEGITFLYPPYDIGCYASGEIDLNISKEELEGLIKPEAEKYWK